MTTERPGMDQMDPRLVGWVLHLVDLGPYGQETFGPGYPAQDWRIVASRPGECQVSFPSGTSGGDVARNLIRIDKERAHDRAPAETPG
jgi:hypothetical protein